jgi:hypothetical protein
MAAQEDSLLSPITAAADRSESTTLLVAKVSFGRLARARPEHAVTAVATAVVAA